jgi:hypothetical protein
MGILLLSSVRLASAMAVLAVGLGMANPRSARAEETSTASAVPEAESEEHRLRRERIVAFARQRVREMEERKRAQALAAAEAKSAKQTKRRESKPKRAPREVPKPLPEIVDHRSALERQLAASWGWGADRDHQVRVPLPDWQNWQRVRLFGIEHLAAFRYTKQHHILTAVFSVETTAQRPSSLSCMDTFERRGKPELSRYGVHLAPISETASRWDQKPVLVHETEGRVTFLFSRYEFSVAWTAYPAYDHGCLVYATVVLWDGQPELARQVLDRFVAEGVSQVRPLTAELPARKSEPEVPRAAVRVETAASAGRARTE